MWGHRGLFILTLLPALLSAAAQAQEREAFKSTGVITLAAAGADTGLQAAGKVSVSYSLHAAAIYNRPKAAKLLIAGGMPVDLRNEGGLTPLMVAATFGNVEVAEVLIAQGADLAARNLSGHTPLHIAALAGQAPVVKLLLDHGADYPFGPQPMARRRSILPRFSGA